MSLGLEFAQGFLPGRISSNLDFAMNLTGAFVGAMIAVRTGSLDFVWRRFAWVRDRFRPGVHADLGLALLALWFASQLNPSLPAARQCRDGRDLGASRCTPATRSRASAFSR